ncbi:MAG: HAD family hydrolase [Campylobacteraceae bacterium]
MLLIFDMDGTLLDSSLAMLNSVNFAREKLGMELVTKKELESYLNNKNSPKSIEVTDEYLKIFKEHYKENCIKNMKLYNGALDFLQRFQKKYKFAIATNAPDIYANKMLIHCEISNYFSSIVGANSVKEPKPNPEMIDSICQTLHVKKNDTIFIGDSYKDKDAAQNADIEFIFANWGYGQKPEDVKYSASNFAELENIVNQIF